MKRARGPSVLPTPLQVLAIAERTQRATARRTRPGIAVLRATAFASAALTAAALFWRAAADAAAWLGAISVAQAGTALLATMLLTGVLVERARRAMSAAHAASWLASIAVDAQALARHQWRIVARYVGLALVVLVLALTVLSWRANVDPAFYCAAVGMALGTLTLAATIGWWAGGRDMSPKNARGRSARVASAVRGVGFAALAHWPTARLRERSSGQRMSRLLAPAFMLVPAGSSGAVATAMIGFWLVLLIAAQMWFALRDIVPRAAQWLRATPLPAARFAWVMTQRALGVWLCTGVAFVAAAALLGMPLRGAVQGAALIVAAGGYGAGLLLTQGTRSELLDRAALVQVIVIALAATAGVLAACAVLAVLAAANVWRALAPRGQ